jgi:hypothetical protein
MAKPIRISGDIDFNKLLKRLSDDIVKAPAFLRMHKQLREHFAKHEDEVNQSPFFWARRRGNETHLKSAFGFQVAGQFLAPCVLYCCKGKPRHSAFI